MTRPPGSSLDRSPAAEAARGRLGVEPAAASAAQRPGGGWRQQLGGFASFWGVIGLIFAWALVQGAAGHLHYLFAGRSELIVDVAGLDRLDPDDRFRIRLPLDYDHGLAIENAGGDAYTLIPVRGTGNRFVLLQKGHFTLAEVGRPPREFVGRVIGAGLFGDWDAGSATGAIALDVPAEFRRIGVRVPSDVRLLVADWQFRFDEIWQIGLGVLGLAVLIWFAQRLGRAVGGWRPRQEG